MTGFLSCTMAQSNADVSLCVYMPKNSEIPEAALQFLENQLENIATENGTADMVICDRFILTAKVDVLQKDIVAGPPQRISQTLNITLQVGDAVDNKLFASTSLTAVGIGTNLTKSYMEAFKQIRKNDKQVADFWSRPKVRLCSITNNIANLSLLKRKDWPSGSNMTRLSIVWLVFLILVQIVIPAAKMRWYRFGKPE